MDKFTWTDLSVNLNLPGKCIPNMNNTGNMDNMVSTWSSANLQMLNYFELLATNLREETNNYLQNEPKCSKPQLRTSNK